MAEALFNARAPVGWKAASAGTQPVGAVHKRTLALLRRQQIDTSPLSSKSWDTLRWRPDVVITLCGRAAGELGPNEHLSVLRAHWGLDDPALACGSEQQVASVFEQVYLQINARIDALLSWARTGKTGRAALQGELDRLAWLP